MRIRDIMSTNVVSVNEKTSIKGARMIMEAHRIRRLPVMKRDKLVGLVTERMLLEVSPSPATSLSRYEVNYLLGKMTVKDIMVRDPYTISPDMPAEEALRLGQDMGYGAFPVMDSGALVGMITESDIVRVMARILGLREKGERIDVKASKSYINMHRIMNILEDNKAILSSSVAIEEPEENDWLIALRLKSGDVGAIARKLTSSGFDVTYVS